jgi:hypothetical protein
MSKLIKLVGVFSIIIGGYLYGNDIFNVGSALAAQKLNVPSFIYLLTSCILLLASLLAGVGLILGKRFGWYLAFFSFIYLAIKNIIGLAMVLSVADSMSQYYLRYMIQSIMYVSVGSMMTVFLLSSDRMKMFKVNYQRQKIYLLTGIFISVLLTSILNLVTYRLYLS